MNEYKRGGTGMIITIAFRNIFRNKRRTAFCLVAVALAVFFIVLFQGFISGMTRSIDEAVQIFETGHVRAVSKQYEAESEYSPVQYPVAEGESLESITARIKNIPGVKGGVPRIKAMATLQESVIKHAALWGMRMADEARVNYFNLTTRDDGLVEGHWPAPGSNECVVGVRFAAKAGLAIGDRIPLKTISAQFSDKMWSPVITGLFNFDYLVADKETIIVDFDRLQRLLVLGDQTQQIVVFADNPQMSGAIALEIGKMLTDGDVTTRWQDQYWIAMMSAFSGMYILIELVFVVVACLLIVNTITMIIHERIKEIGMMGSLGLTRAEIVRVFFFESVFLAMSGAFAGILIGGILTGILQFYPIPFAAAYGESTFASAPMGSTLFIGFSWAGLLQAWVMGVVVASIFTLIPSLKSAFVEPVEALRR